MTKRLYVLLALLVTALSHAEVLSLPQGKAKCPHFTFEGESGWKLKSGRTNVSRWLLVDSNANQQIAEFDYGLDDSTQRQLRKVDDKVIQLGSYKVEKYTVTLDPSKSPEEATTQLFTSYTFTSGKLKGLVVQTPKYDAASGLDQRIEKALATIK
jgi:hypothetical protein